MQASGVNRLKDVPGTFNFRDVGGYTADGGSTKWGALYRSDALNKLTAEGVSAMQELGVQSVIDLRDPRERSKAPDILPEGVRLIEHAVFPDALSHINLKLDIQKLTELIFFEHAANVTSAVGMIAKNESASVVHCTAGKDRTGAVIALALSAVGVSQDDILADYEATQKNLAGAWLENHLRGLRKLNVELTPEVLGLVSTSPLDVMERALKMIDHEYGSSIDYLRAHGLSDSSIAALHTRLVS